MSCYKNVLQACGFTFETGPDRGVEEKLVSFSTAYGQIFCNGKLQTCPLPETPIASWSWMYLAGLMPLTNGRCSSISKIVIVVSNKRRADLYIKGVLGYTGRILVGSVGLGITKVLLEQLSAGIPYLLALQSGKIVWSGTKFSVVLH